MPHPHTERHREYFALSYDEAGYLRSVTDHTGRVFAYEIKDGRLTEAMRPDGGAFAYTYDGNGKLSAGTNPRGIITVENQFDEDHFNSLTRSAEVYEIKPIETYEPGMKYHKQGVSQMEGYVFALNNSNFPHQ